MVETDRRAKLFQTGRSQAVRLPKEFRFEGTEVRIRRAGDAVVLEPVNKDWQWLEDLRAKFSGFDEDFVAAAEEEVPEQERPELKNLFP